MMNRQLPAVRKYDSYKRGLDVLAAALGLVLTAPIQLLVAVFVAAKLGRPVLFRQDRPGKNGRIFRLYKFRSMKDVDEANGVVSDEQRLTSFGRKLRASSLDELPTLWNVLRGDMSIVGPRPLLVKYLNLYTPEQAQRHAVRPGVTGLAQVSGRNSLSWDQKFARDVEYVERRSLLLDISILVKTANSVVRSEGISADGHATMHDFTGSSESTL